MKKLPANFEYTKYGMTIKLARIEDAEFIHSLRTNPKSAPFMHIEGCTLETQRIWLEQYKEREKRGIDYYFVYYKDDEPIGVDRLYHINETDFHCGSWVFKHGLPAYCSMAGAIMAREIAFEILEKNIEYNHKDGIVSSNTNVLRFMTMLGFKKTGEHVEGKFCFINGILTKEDFETNKSKIIRFVPKELQ